MRGVNRWRDPRTWSCAALVATTWLAPGQTHAQPSAYQLHASLDSSTHTITASGRITFENRTNGPLQELWLHLYLNAFKNDRTLFYRSPFERARGGATPSEWGSVTIDSLTDDRGEDLWSSANFPTPDDETLARVPLPHAVAPGDSLSLNIEWRSKLPSVVDRTGFADDYHFAGQWYPKLAKLEPDGRWDAANFHPYAEFYADFCDYDVTLELPSGFVVGATGQLVEERFEDQRQTKRYVAQRVHDFAWTAWPGFLEHEEQIAGTTVTFLYPPGHEHNLLATEKAIAHGLGFFGQHYGPYPYPSLTVVHPPREGSASGGMEYPQLITTGGSWYANHLTRAVEQVTLHELAHQWFYGLLASNERRFPFLDEGFASYADGQAAEALYGNASGVDVFGFEVSALSYYRLLGLARGHDAAIARAAAEFPSFGHVGAIVYGRTATVLHTFERVHGTAFTAGLGDYARRHRFGHPTPDDLRSSLTQHLSSESVDALTGALENRGWVDFAVTSLESTRRPTRSGAVDDSIATHDLDEYVGRAVIVRRGTLVFPVEIVLTDAAGAEYRSHWDGEGEWTEVDYSGGSELVSAVVDPTQRVLLDENLGNNSQTRAARPPVKASALAAFFCQVFTHLFGA